MEYKKESVNRKAEGRITPISRRKFLQLCGSAVALSTIVGTSSLLLSRIAKGGETEGCQAYPNGVSNQEAHCKKCGVKECPIRKGVNI